MKMIDLNGLFPYNKNKHNSSSGDDEFDILLAQAKAELAKMEKRLDAILSGYSELKGDSDSPISLEEKLNKAIKNENYELAAQLRDEIQRQK